MTPDQSRMGRAALSWSRSDLAKVAGVGAATVVRFEAGQPVQPETVEKLQRALESVGVRFQNKGPLAGAVLPPR